MKECSAVGWMELLPVRMILKLCIFILIIYTHNDNMLSIQYYYNRVDLMVNNHRMSSVTSTDVESLWTELHKHCFTWKVSGAFKVSVFAIIRLT